MLIIILRSFFFFKFHITVILPNNQSQPKEISIAFQCEKPISTTVQLKFIDDQNHVYPYNVVVTADNSLFTCYGFLADHQSEYHIVLEEVSIVCFYCSHLNIKSKIDLFILREK